MAKKIDGYIKLQIPAGQANPSPPVGPALGQKGVNIMEFCKAFNASTQKMDPGMPIPVVITVFVDKRLISIFQSCYKEIRFVDLETIPAVSDFDAHLPMGSLLSLFRNDKSKFTMEPKAYLTPTTPLNSYVKRGRKSITKPICGISWFTKANQVPDDRKIDLEILVKTLGNFDLEIFIISRFYIIVPKHFSVPDSNMNSEFESELSFVSI